MGYKDSKKRKRKADKGNTGAVSLVKGSFIGLVVSLCAVIVLWFVCSLAAYSYKDPDAILPVLAFCGVSVAAFVGGIVASKKHGEGGMVCGLLSGAMLAILLLFVSFAFGKEYSSENGMAAKLLIRLSAVLLSVLGGAVGRYKRPKRRPKRRK